MYEPIAHLITPISIDCIKQCPYQSELYAIAFYQTNPDTKGGIAVDTIRSPTDLTNIHII